MGVQLHFTSIVLYALFTSSSALYNEWNGWSPCSKSCNGEQSRTRSCQTTTLQPCESKTQKRTCNTSDCYPSSEVIITCAVLGALILLLLVILIIILIKRRTITSRITNQENRKTVLDFEKSASNGQKINDVNIHKNNAERTLSATPSTASQVTYLPTDGSADSEKTFQPWGQKDCDLY